MASIMALYGEVFFTYQLSKELFNKSLVLERLTVINIAGSYHEAQLSNSPISLQIR